MLDALATSLKMNMEPTANAPDKRICPAVFLSFKEMGDLLDETIGHRKFKISVVAA